MKKLIFLSILVLGAGALFQGCMITDHPAPGMGVVPFQCDAACGGVDNPTGWIDLVMGVEGPAGTIYPDERGEYWYIMQPMQVAGDTGGEVACPMDPGGGGGAGGDANQIIDSYHNEAGAYAVGCPPAYVCYWQVGISWGSGGVCPPAFGAPIADSFCNLGNGACRLNPFGFGGPTFDPGPDAFLNEIYYRNYDTTPGQPCEFDLNQVREPGDLCPDCSAMTPTPGDDHKTLICHTPRGNPDNAHTINIDVAAVPAHIAHGDPADSVGRGCGGGGGPTGPGMLVPAGNNAPAWGAATCFFVDYIFQTVQDGLPWTDDYSGGDGLAASAAEELFAILRNNPVGEGGLVSIGIQQIHAPSASIEFSSPFTLDVNWNFENGRLEQVGMLDATQAALPEFISFLLDNTRSGQELDWTGWRFDLTSGDVLKGSSLMKANNQRAFAIGHERLSKALEDIQTLSASPEPTRLESPRISRR